MIGLYFSGTGDSKHCLNAFLDQFGKKIPRVEIEDPRKSVDNKHEVIYIEHVQNKYNISTQDQQKKKR
jgi:hypothetical protein